MKKLILILAIFISVCWKVLHTVPLSDEEYLNKSLDIDVSKCIKTNKKDTHGGFLGDGETFMLLDCSAIDDQVFSEWKPLPLPDVLKKRIYEDICCYDECVTTSVRYSIPEFSDGYYFFNNRHDEAESKDDLNIYEPYSYNFTIAIFDKTSKQLYYYELDT